MLQEFQKFIARGNVIDLAVGVIMGTAFGAIVNSAVNDIIMPPIGALLGGVDFSNLYVVVSEAKDAAGNLISVPAGASLSVARDTGAAIIAYGAFINTVINFLIVAFAVFLMVRAVNGMIDRMKRQEAIEEAAAPPSAEEKLLTAIESLTAAVEKKL